ncbi:MAG: hypothetical protein PHR45_03855 [Muribaculaceae bacterium]|nr:hypothetical protein [Muribaculaceae bacterium]
MKYSDEKDKCYGVVGMAIGLNVWDAEDLFSSITIDADGYDCIDFTHEYYFTGTPTISPKASWQHQLKIYKIMMGITISNVMCRCMVGDGKQLNRGDKEELLSIFIEQGDEEYSLSKEECVAIFDKSYNYLLKLYSHYQVKSMVKEFVDKLAQKRKMSSCEVQEAIALLNN